MAEFKINVEDVDAPRMLSALANKVGWKEKILEKNEETGESSLIDNPETINDAARRFVIGEIKRVVKDYEYRNKLQEAQNSIVVEEININ